jgi:hypothetical protein
MSMKLFGRNIAKLTLFAGGHNDCPLSPTSRTTSASRADSDQGIDYRVTAKTLDKCHVNVFR